MTLSRPVSSLAPSAVGRKIFMTKMAWPREERAFILMLATVRLRLLRAMTAISSLAVFTVASATRTHKDAHGIPARHVTVWCALK